MTTQTTSGMTFISARVFVSADNATWTDVSGHGASVAVSGFERMVGSQNTMVGDVPVVKGGKRGPGQVTVRYMYTEEGSDPFEILRAIHETAGGAIYLQYAPKTGFWFKTGLAVLERPGYPNGDPGSGELLMSEFVVSAAQLSKAAAST